MLITAAENRGGHVLALPGACSILTCAECGHIDPVSRSRKAFRCTGCGHSDDAGVNAARVMAQRGQICIAALEGGRTPEEARNTVWAHIIGATRDARSVEPSAESQGDTGTDSEWSCLLARR